MGMAASQARLLTITARLADNELRSQTINNAKMRLATQSSQASENYINALNNATMTFTNYDLEGESVSQKLSFNALTTYSSYNTQYGLVNSSGQLLVSEKEATIFENAGNNLTNYLKAHGLEYKTTYFKTLGNVKNEAYTEPYSNISSESLEDYYNKYVSYENSLEVENFESAVERFSAISNNLALAGNEIMQKYLTEVPTGSTVAPLTYANGQYSLNFTSTTATDLLTEFQQAFSGYTEKSVDSKDTYNFNLDKLVSDQYLGSAYRDELLDEIHTYSIDPTRGLKTTKGMGTGEEKHNADGTTTYTFANEGVSFTVDTLGLTVVSHDFTALKANEEKDSYTYKDSDGNEVTVTYTLTDNGPTAGNPNEISYSTQENGEKSKTDYFYYDNVNKTFCKYSFIDATSTDTIRNELNGCVDRIINQILNEANYENFIDDVQTPGEDLNNKYGTTTIAALNNKSINDVMTEYNEAKANFLPYIFDNDSLSIVESDKANGTEITMYDGNGNPIQTIDSNGNTVDYTRDVTDANLKDIEFILQYAKQRGLSFNDDFNTVIKEYIMDQVIEVNGTPKYAWVDENDTSNTGNADAKAQWYTNLFNRMQQGYKRLEDGLASSNEWIEYALESGIVSMEQVDKNFTWNALDYKACSRITEVTDDAAVAKAEAEYNRAMNDIKAKDNIYDLQLKNIDTEHSALQTEYSVIEKVIQENVKRTFKFDQSA